jgi:hypothetical protein
MPAYGDAAKDWTGKKSASAGNLPEAADKTSAVELAHSTAAVQVQRHEIGLARSPAPSANVWIA